MIRGLPPRGGGQRLRNGDSGPARRREEIGPGDSRLVVVVIQGNPGNRAGFRGGPQRQGRRLARAGRAGDNGQRAPPRTLGDQLGDPRAVHRPVRHTRRRDPRCRDRKVSRNCRPPGGDRHLLGSTCTWSQPERSGALESRHSYLPTGVTLDSDARACANRSAVAFVSAGPNVAMGAAPSLASSIATRFSRRSWSDPNPASGAAASFRLRETAQRRLVSHRPGGLGASAACTVEQPSIDP
jgi:hypothetical protein